MTTPYVINLDRSPDRWEKIQKEWKGVFPLKRLPAVEASPGWVGCGLSHVKAVEEAKARGDPWVLVWEDDCIPRKRNGEASNVHMIRKLWDAVMAQLSKHPTRWDIVLGATSRVLETPQRDTELSTNMISVYRLPRGFTTHWTLYNAAIYDYIIQWKDTRPSPIDVYMYEKARIYVTVPFLAEQRSGFSTVESKDADYSSLFNSAERELKSFGVKIERSLPIVPQSLSTYSLPKVPIKLLSL